MALGEDIHLQAWLVVLVAAAGAAILPLPKASAGLVLLDKEMLAVEALVHRLRILPLLVVVALVLSAARGQAMVSADLVALAYHILLPVLM